MKCTGNPRITGKVFAPVSNVDASSRKVPRETNSASVKELKRVNSAKRFITVINRSALPWLNSAADAEKISRELSSEFSVMIRAGLKCRD